MEGLAVVFKANCSYQYHLKERLNVQAMTTVLLNEGGVIFAEEGQFMLDLVLSGQDKYPRNCEGFINYYLLYLSLSSITIFLK